MTARLDLLAHGSTEATRSARFPTDEPLEPHAVAVAGALRGQLRNYSHVLTAPSRAARETVEALGLIAEIEASLRDCDYGRWQGLTSKEVAEREPGAFAQWVADMATTPHGGEPIAAVIHRTGVWLTEASLLQGTTLAVTHAAIVRAAIVYALGAGSSTFARIDVGPLSLARLSGHAGRWNLVALGPLEDLT